MLFSETRLAELKTGVEVNLSMYAHVIFDSPFMMRLTWVGFVALRLSQEVHGMYIRTRICLLPANWI